MIHPAIRRIDRQTADDTNVGEGLQRTRMQVYDVILKEEFAKTVEPSDVVLDERLPQYLYPYLDRAGGVYDPFCVMRTFRINRDEANYNTLRIVYNFSTTANSPFAANDDRLTGSPIPRQGNSGSTSDPTKMAPKFSFRTETVRIPLLNDLSDPVKRVVNTAGERFLPVPTREFALRVITYRRYEAVWRPAFWDSFNYKLNDAVWNQYPKNWVLSMPPEVDDWEAIGPFIFFPVTYTFKIADNEFMPALHQLSIENYGFTHKENPAAAPVPCRVGANIAANPQPLDANGKQITNGDAPAVSTFKRYLEADFSALNIRLPIDNTDFSELP